MVDFHETTPMVGLVPVEVEGCVLSERDFVPLASVMPHTGKQVEVAKALKELTKLVMPKAAKAKRNASKGMFWNENNQWFVEGVDVSAVEKALKDLAAVTDQSDAWARFQITGEHAEAVLARLCPLDLSEEAFAKDAAARSELSHMMCAISRCKDGYNVMVLRSFARTVAHDVTNAMRSIAAQTSLHSGATG